MKPPICRVCGREFHAASQQDEGALLRFQPAEDQEPLDDHETGHPSNQAWFCADHVGAARELTDCTLPEALDRLDERFG